MFHTDVAKVDQDVAYVAIVVHVCCKLMFSMFHLFFSDVCCKCVYLNVAYVFKDMIQVFYLDIVYVYNGFKCFSNVSDTYLNISFVFRRILQLLCLNVLKLNRVLNLPSRISVVSPRYQAREASTGRDGPH